MTDAEVQAALVDETALALTMWGEARGDWRQGNSSVEERIAVGCVIRNRLPRFWLFKAVANNYASVCLAPHQFSCWTAAGGSANYKAVMAQARALTMGLSIEPVVDECIYLARGIIGGRILDRTKGATMYYAPAAMNPKNTMPAWALGKTGQPIGEQVFFV